MNKYVALALAACLFTAVSAQNSTANSTTSGTTLSWCRANTDCAQNQGFCCSSAGVSAGYLQFNCNKHTNGTASVGKCISNVTNDYTENCAGQDKICTSSASKATYCGGSFVMTVVDALPNVDCISTSSAYSLMMSVAFFAMVALSFVF